MLFLSGFFFFPVIYNYDFENEVFAVITDVTPIASM